IVTEHLSPTNVDAEVLEETNPVISPANEEVADNFDPDLIKALGETETEQGEFGVDLQPDIASRFQQILINGLKKETREELLKKYLFPSNVPLAKAPTLNPEVAAMLVETCRLRDKRLYGKQDQLGRALAAVGKALTYLLKKNPDIAEVMSTLNDAGKLIADSHYAETDTRRSVIIPLVDKSLIESFKDRKRDSFLFGDKLGDLVNTSKGIKKTSQFIQASTSANAGLNSTGPPPTPYRPRQQRARQYYPRRVTISNWKGWNTIKQEGGKSETPYNDANAIEGSDKSWTEYTVVWSGANGSILISQPRWPNWGNKPYFRWEPEPHRRSINYFDVSGRDNYPAIYVLHDLTVIKKGSCQPPNQRDGQRAGDDAERGEGDRLQRDGLRAEDWSAKDGPYIEYPQGAYGK
ncbi:uncharacterized protein LOC134662622, partial [Cydia amplana]|uniref:uncharacterized protein LOC134662622 n=1 Tax=Cydia amplana TaxID=1869771 RepID=UPI002FE531B1